MSTKRVNYNWVPKKIDNVKSTKNFSAEFVLDHPLKHPVSKIKENRCKRSDRNSVIEIKVKSSGSFSDPLGLIDSSDDPLSSFQKKKHVAQNGEDEDWNYNGLNIKTKGELESWDVRKKNFILNRYASNELLKTVHCFSIQDRAPAERARGEQNDYEDGIVYEVCDMMPQEYSQRLTNFHQIVINEWNQDQKVKALKIVIQCAKLLNESHEASFYPIKFVYITDILDTFGTLVFNRLKTLCETSNSVKINNTDKGLKVNPQLFDVAPDGAKETCRNWFYKIASIRELIPRFYVEAAISRCYAFIVNGGEHDKVLLRLTKMIRGLGDPLVAIYARCYLCRIGVMLNVKKFDFFKENFSEFLLVYDQIFNRNLHLNKKINLSEYLEAFSPALQYIVQGMVNRLGTEICNDVFRHCKSKSNNSLLLYMLLGSFKTEYVISHASEFISWLSETKNAADIPLCKSLQELAEHFQVAMINDEHRSITPELLMEIWNVVSSIDNADHFIITVQLWMPISVSYFTIDKVNTLLGDIISHLNYDLLYEKYYTQLENILRGIMENTHVSDFIPLFTMDNFPHYVNLFHSENSRTPVCKLILENFVKRTPDKVPGDRVLTNLMSIAKTLHNSINALTVEDEKRQIGNLICSFIMRLDFGDNVEEEMEFYVNARATFYNFDSVYFILVQKVNKLSMNVLQQMKGRHTAKTSSFVRACMSYSFITIPSIQSELDRFKLYLVTGQVALANHCYGQADSCFVSAINLISDFPHTLEITGKVVRSAEPFLISYVSELLSILLLVPDSQTQGTLFLLRSLINKLQHYKWDDNSTARSQIYIKALHMLSIAVQPVYPYHFINVDSNDVLYSSDKTFILEVNGICSIILEQILKHLQALESQPKKQAEISFQLFNCVFLCADVTEKSMAKLALILWNLSVQNKMLDNDLSKRTIEYYKRKQFDSDEERNEIYKKLISMMNEQ